jgi:ABC-type nitrate/sulfonate/bicarbonate transport system substrate-binding protein
MSKGKIAALSSVLLLVVIAGYLWQAGFLAQKAGPPPGPPEKLTIGAVLSTSSSLLVIAQEQGYFRDNGLEVNLKFLPTGPKGLKQLKDGQIDVADCSDFVLVDDIFKGPPFLRCLGTIGAVDINQMMARKDRGILQPGDLKGKRLGVARGTIAEFFLGRFLTFHSLKLSEVQVIDFNTADMAVALADGRVDAVMAWEPISYEIMKEVGDKLLSWRGQANQKFYIVLVSTEAFSKARPEALERLFLALAQGENFIKHNREEGLAIIGKWLNLDTAVFKTDWLNSDYELSFDQGLLISMEDQARWMMRHKFTEQTRLPDFLNYFEVGPMARAVPEAVRVVIPKFEGKDAPGRVSQDRP